MARPPTPTSVSARYAAWRAIDDDGGAHMQKIALIGSRDYADADRVLQEMRAIMAAKGRSSLFPGARMGRTHSRPLGASKGTRDVVHKFQRAMVDGS